MNPLDFTGPEFILFYIFVLTVAAALAVGVRWFLRQPGGEPDRERIMLAPYEVAYLAGGNDLACNAAITLLVYYNVLQVNPTKGEVRVCAALPASAHEIENAVFQGAVVHDGTTKHVIPLISPGTWQDTGGTRVAAVRSAAKMPLQFIHDRLAAAGFVLTPEQKTLVRAWPALIVLSVLLLGIAKIIVGMSRGRPIGFLVMLCTATGFLAFAFGSLWPVHRTRRGDRALAQLKQSNAALSYYRGARLDFGSGHNFVLALGLFGIGVLSGGPLAELARALSPAPSSGGMSGGSCSSSSCSSSSCGGGCGGGCGGCGS